MTRSEVRALALKLLYSLEIQKVEKEQYLEQINLFMEANEITNEKAYNYIKETIDGITENRQEIEKLISQNLTEKWDISRISKINLVLLRLSIYEMLYSKLPYKVIINEAVELAKKYGEETSPSFINGILANIVKTQGIVEEN